ncbi:hypothetical protein AGMMS50230_04110 [Spirochaetia bacterium]|nr:hypothetical protein AGMMS50230_04110 [Spirochaetia bacterium]
MKNFAKLVLFFCFSFVGILAAASLLGLLEEWAGQAVIFPPSPGNSGAFTGNMLMYLTNSLPATFYLSIMLALSYATRRRMAYPAVFMLILVFVLALSGAVFFGLETFKQIGGFTITMKKPPTDLVKPGFILALPIVSETTVLLTDPYQPGGPRAVTSNDSLNYQSQGNTLTIRLPFVPVKNAIFGNINRELEHSARVFSAWFREGFLPYGIYAGSLALFLLSLGCLVNISFWSLANLFFAALAFRGALALENLLNQTKIHTLLASFAGNIIPESLVNPVIFTALAFLILLYSGLVYLARGRADG